MGSSPNSFLLHSSRRTTDNWFEDRVQESLQAPQYAKPANANLSSLYSASDQPIILEHLERHDWPDSRRTLPILSKGEDAKSAMYLTTYKSTMPESIASNKSLGKGSAKKFLVNRLNLGNTVRTPRVLGNGDDLLPRHPPTKDAKYLETTNGMMYGKNPEQVRKNWQSNPPPERGNDERFIGGFAAKCNPNDHSKRPFYGDSRYFFRNSRIEKDSYDTHMFTAQPRGKCGARGELVRLPDESGSTMGATVWADEYGTGKIEKSISG